MWSQSFKWAVTLKKNKNPSKVVVKCAGWEGCRLLLIPVVCFCICRFSSAGFLRCGSKCWPRLRTLDRSSWGWRSWTAARKSPTSPGASTPSTWWLWASEALWALVCTCWPEPWPETPLDPPSSSLSSSPPWPLSWPACAMRNLEPVFPKRARLTSTPTWRWGNCGPSSLAGTSSSPTSLVSLDKQKKKPQTNRWWCWRLSWQT